MEAAEAPAPVAAPVVAEAVGADHEAVGADHEAAEAVSSPSPSGRGHLPEGETYR